MLRDGDPILGFPFAESLPSDDVMSISHQRVNLSSVSSNATRDEEISMEVVQQLGMDRMGFISVSLSSIDKGMGGSGVVPRSQLRGVSGICYARRISGGTRERTLVRIVAMNGALDPSRGSRMGVNGAVTSSLRTSNHRNYRVSVFSRCRSMITW